MPFILKTPSFYQDRLGTNIGEALKLIQRDAFLQEEPDARLETAQTSVLEAPVDLRGSRPLSGCEEQQQQPLLVPMFLKTI